MTIRTAVRVLEHPGPSGSWWRASTTDEDGTIVVSPGATSPRIARRLLSLALRSRT